MKNWIPDWMRDYFRWLSTRRRYPGVQISQSSIISGDSRIDAPGVINARCQVQRSALGAFSYCGNDVSLYCAEIGKFCSLASRVTVGGGIHPLSQVSTSPVFYSTAGQIGRTFATENTFQEHKQTIIGNDVWIGHAATVLPGVRVGDGAVIGAGAVVTKDIGDYVIAAGIPARALKTRFEADTIKWLLARQWWNESEPWLQEHWRDFSEIEGLKKLQ